MALENKVNAIRLKLSLALLDEQEAGELRLLLVRFLLELQKYRPAVIELASTLTDIPLLFRDACLLVGGHISDLVAQRQLKASLQLRSLVAELLPSLYYAVEGRSSS